MNEEFLSYLWKFRQLNPELITESGDPLTILHPGEQNTDSGPDFFNARLRIGNTTWAGNIEIHVRASDWFRHGHQTDPAYDNAILHVVYESDTSVNHQTGEPLQTLVLKGQFPAMIFDRYQTLMQNQQWIPCYHQLPGMNDSVFSIWAPSLAVERLIYKSVSIKQLWVSCGHDWEEALYRHLAWSFGFKLNSLPFELLAKSLPLKIIRQHCDQVFRLEAMLFGQAGMLEENYADIYPHELLHEYQFLRDKYKLKPIEGSWKFLRLRPTNFPTLRISQWAGFLHLTRARLFSMIEGGSFDEVNKLLNVSASDYWDTHYTFKKSCSSRKKVIGENCINLLIINGLVPFLFFYGMEKDQPTLCEMAIKYLEQVKGEDNSEIVYWKKAGQPCTNALQTQALLHLKRFYCDKKRCLSCRIGSVLLAKSDRS